MTHYFWLVRPENEGLEKTATEYKQKISDDFGERSASLPPLDVARLVYLNDDGKPVMASCVTQTPEHNTGFKNVELVGQAESVECLVDARGVMQLAGHDYCLRRGIEPCASNIFMEATNFISSMWPILKEGDYKPLTLSSKK